MAKGENSMTSERGVTSGAKVALLGAALLLVVSACGEQPAEEETDQGAAPASQEADTAAATGDQGQVTEGAQQQ
jgi:outer membrane lipoprotein-sorting protein